MSIYSACLTVKYNRYSGNDELANTEFHAGWTEHLILIAANIIKFALPVGLVLYGIPDEDISPAGIIEHHIGVSDSLSFKYEFDYPITNLSYPVLKIKDYADDWQFAKGQITANELLRYPSLGKARSGQGSEFLDIIAWNRV
jgi:hypothetical protein